MTECNHDWLNAPSDAFRQWQKLEATGATGRSFSDRSIVQHSAMFERFLRFLAMRGTNVAHFGEDQFAAFLEDLAGDCRAGTSTVLRYAKLIDRICRHLVGVGLRTDNPAAIRARVSPWPTKEPVPAYLNESADIRLQAALQGGLRTDARTTRNRAAVALLLATGITSAEVRRARREHVIATGNRLRFVVAAHGARAERIVPIAPFASDLLDDWLQDSAAPGDELLFPLRGPGGSLSEETLWRAVREALDAQGHGGGDTSPRVLRNTFGRRLLIAGRSNDEVSRLMGLTSQRTVVRLRATLPVSGESLTLATAP
ncbi:MULTISPECIES: site-specific integrase [unclassified Paraburkholderia]|uniref:tyrosine-type recombinase/integrase n=1 Tax=unclassified Paraburkholderia TaxID=2615204 RepID=UPI002AB10AE2|nr:MULTISPECIES: site-specific integrase [unclassified Paraburkholderia]